MSKINRRHKPWIRYMVCVARMGNRLNSGVEIKGETEGGRLGIVTVIEQGGPWSLYDNKFKITAFFLGQRDCLVFGRVVICQARQEI